MISKSKRLFLLIAAATIFATANFSSVTRAEIPATAADVTETAPLPPDKIPKEITDAINAPDRPASDKALDAGRRPEQIMAFYDIKPGMKIADIFAAGGYMTELLSRTVGSTGKVYSQNGPFPPQFQKIGDAWQERLKEPALKNVVAVSKPYDAEDLLPVEPGTLDAVIIHLNYHDMVGFKLNRDNVNAAVFKALRPGGVYGIVDHSAKPGTGDSDTATLHRIDEKFLVKDVEKAGFRLVAASKALRHPEDDRTWKVFDKRGQTDRFMLKFVKTPRMAAADTLGSSR
jgi:predicted methyltransferase